jgi:Leucine-rich repeat (LRR) protein
MSLRNLLWSSSIEFDFRYNDSKLFLKTDSLQYKTIKEPEKIYSFCFRDCEFFQNFNVDLFPNIHFISFENVRFNSLTDLEFIGKCKNLKKLRFKNANLMYLSTFIISNDINLESLIIDNCNKLDIIDIKQIKTLKELHINNNNLINIDDLIDLTQLVVLNLNKNTLVNINGISNLINLESLNLDNNSLIELKEISNLPKLKYLYANGNLIRELWISPCISLKYIELSNNCIEKIKILESSSNLEGLNLKGNFIKHLFNLGKLTNFNYDRFQIDWQNIIEIEGMKSFPLIKCMILGLKN